MILQGLRTLARGYSRNLAIHSSINHIQRCVPSSLLQTARSYSAYYEDDDDDWPTAKQKGGRDNRSGYASRYGGGSGGGGYRRFNDRQSGGYSGRSSNGFGNRGFQPRQQQQQQQQTLRAIDWSNRELAEFDKNFYNPSEATTNRSVEEVLAFRKENNITVPQGAPKPILSFEELNGLPPSILKNINASKFSECTPIQAQGMPIALSGQNMVGIAQTG